MVRVTGDTLAFSPPLIIEESHIEALVENIRSVLRSL
jgi:adenosylmethionine-8-amino-7-oxononanoate aminotransferase